MILAISVSHAGCSRIARPKPQKSITIRRAASKRAGGCKIFYSLCANDRHFEAGQNELLRARLQGAQKRPRVLINVWLTASGSLSGVREPAAFQR